MVQLNTHLSGPCSWQSWRCIALWLKKSTSAMTLPPFQHWICLSSLAVILIPKSLATVFLRSFNKRCPNPCSKVLPPINIMFFTKSPLKFISHLFTSYFKNSAIPIYIIYNIYCVYPMVVDLVCLVKIIFQEPYTFHR